MNQASLFTLLKQQPMLRPLDLAFADFLQVNCSSPVPDLVLSAAALTSLQLGRGHICLDLQQLAATPAIILQGEYYDESSRLLLETLTTIPVNRWLAELQYPEAIGSGAGVTPLVLQGNRLYLRRYWQYEQQISKAVSRRLIAFSNEQPEMLPELLSALFPETQSIASAPDWQQIACALASRGAFSVITGGPGTGKTTTVVKLLALLQLLQHRSELPLLQIRLAAPTGKAAARLKESISKAFNNLQKLNISNWQQIVSGIPTDVTTLHRLLGARDGSRQYAFNAERQLPLDVLVIDEASMIDVEMMAKMLQALPDDARLILLGDKDQLSSVEAGAILGELCQYAAEGRYLPQTAAWLKQFSRQQLPDELISTDGHLLDQHITMLRHSYRFNAGEGIGLLAAAVNQGVLPSAIWQQNAARLQLLTPSAPADHLFQQLILDGGKLNGGFRTYLTKTAATVLPENADQWAADILQTFTGFQLLCATRKGPWGTEQLNLLAEKVLHNEKLIDNRHHWYNGRPVLVTRNDYNLGLMNGDIGICLARPELTDTGAIRQVLRVAFLSNDGEQRIRWILPSRLSAVETVYTMTVHKSQGSEFRHTVLVLPEQHSGLLNRELIYTAVTRASEYFTLVCSEPAVLQQAIASRTTRAGGLSLILGNS